MTAILAIVGARAPLEVGVAVRALRRAGARAGSELATTADDGAIFGAAQWPSRSAATPPAHCAGLARDDRFTVVADATLYYLADLGRALGWVHPHAAATNTPAQLVLAAFRAFGDRCVEHLEGDFAFAVWDRQARRLFCARDFTGRRPLYVAERHGGLIVASALASIAAVPGFDAQVDIATVGADAASLFFSLDDETCLRGVRAVGGGCTASWSERRPVQRSRAWHPAPSHAGSLGFDEASVHLRGLLEQAVMERTSSEGRTAVWMSGGRDSTAVFAAGMSALRTNSHRGELFPVSRSHPPGDSGREDESVEAIARFWDVTPTWVDARDVPMFAPDESTALWATESFTQPFEQLTRGLARAARDGGATIALDGYGGDFLFQVSRVYLADLVARGHMSVAWDDWRTIDRGREGVRGFLRAGVQPLMPRWALRAAGVALGRPIRGAMERVVPPWISRQFLAAHAIEERLRERGPDAQPGRSAVERETNFYLTHSFFARVNAMMAGYALEHGLELRSPLLDRRVVSFALGRPREERNRAGDQKRLLRAAMRGLLPESVLAPRVGKSGTLTTYFGHHMHHDGLASLKRMLPAPALAARGVVEPALLSAAVERFSVEGASYRHTEALFCTLQAERWLHTHDGVGAYSHAASTRARSA